MTLARAIRLEVVRGSGTRSKALPTATEWSGQWGMTSPGCPKYENICPWGSCFSKVHIAEVRLESIRKWGACGEGAEDFCEYKSFLHCVQVQRRICHNFITYLLLLRPGFKPQRASGFLLPNNLWLWPKILLWRPRLFRLEFWFPKLGLIRSMWAEWGKVGWGDSMLHHCITFQGLP